MIYSDGLPEADEEDICLRVGEWPQPVVILLARRVEEAERVGLAPDHHCHRIVVENLTNNTNKFE